LRDSSLRLRYGPATPATAARDEKWGERPLAFVVCQADATVAAESIREHLLHHVEARRISKYAVPEANHIRFVDEIPKTSVGKINEKLLRDPLV
jgi:fatty-acyl-CoA synthase